MSIKFSLFFNSWLHENYYKNSANIGKKGDFYTSASVGSLFGVTLSYYFLNLLRKGEFNPSANIVEIGANDGSMMCDFISGIFTFAPEILQTLKFNVIEPHESLRNIQKAKFKREFGDEIFVKHFASLNECKFDEAFFISNELFDSFACEVVSGDKMLFADSENKIYWNEADSETLAMSEKFGVKKGEITLGLYKFASESANSAKKLKFITFDYGQMGASGEISLRIFKDHQVFNLFEIKNLSEFFGVSDITYNLNFSQLKSEFEEAGLKFERFERQSAALVDFKASEILEFALKNGGKKAYSGFLKQFKFLTNPEFLGEKFKMIEFSKGL